MVGLHDFLARALDVLTLAAAVEARQAAISSRLAELEELSLRDATRTTLLLRLQAEHCQTVTDLERAVELLASFSDPCANAP